jgi:hypothetical protein
MRATRRIDQLRLAQKETVGLAKGGGDHRVKEKPGAKPTLASQGIDKNLANQARFSPAYIRPGKAKGAFAAVACQGPPS